MLSGRRLDLLDPSPLDVELSDIAHGLARVARWNGQTHGDHSFSVAQHSLLVTSIFQTLKPDASLEEQMVALLHDAPEYVIGDMISPFKAIIGDGYKAVEERLQEAIHMRFSLPVKVSPKLKGAIKKADMISAFFEATELAGFERAEARKYFGLPRGFSSHGLELEPWSTLEAEERFITSFNQLEEARDN